MQANNRTDAGCTVDAVPYKVLDLEASKLNFAGPDVKATPVMAVPLVLENAPVGVVPFVFPTGWNVPVMFGPNITGSIKPFNVACDDFTASGALSGGKSSTPWNGKTNVGSSVITDIALAASNSDAKYGASSTVQPTSLRLVHCIKS